MLGFRRLLIALALSSAFIWISSAPALAAGNPGRQPNTPLPAPFTQAMCGPAIGDVTVSVDPATFRSFVKTFTLQDGNIKIQFNGFAREIVQGNGKTLSFNVSGPGYFLVTPLGGFVTAVGQGHGFYTGPVGSPQPGLKLYTGLVVYAMVVVDPYGPIFVVASSTGHVTDVCAMLA
jgi:hypothetical protein